MAATDEIVCPVCGVKNVATAPRCNSCGARLEALGPAELTEEEERAREHQQETFEWKWVAIAFAVFLVLEGFVLGLLPLVIPNYDPQGLPGILLTTGVFLVGGIIVGAISPGKTFIEPAVGALLAVIPSMLYLAWIDEVYDLSLLTYIVGGLLAVMITLFGSFLGEKLQGDKRRAPRARTRTGGARR